MSAGIRSIASLVMVIGIAACGGGGAATQAPSAAAPSAVSSAAGPDDVAFAWCIDITNQVALNKAARGAGVDLDHIQAIHTVAGGSVEQFHADLRADPDYMKACTAAYATH